MSFQFTRRNQRMKIIGHIPNASAKVYGLISEWKSPQVIYGKHRDVPKGNMGVELRFPAFIFFMG